MSPRATRVDEPDAAVPTATRAVAELEYQRGFGNHFSTEALAGALPAQNSPQRCPYGLYAEQLSGTAFTAPRSSNRRSWLFRIRPAAVSRAFVPLDRAAARQPISLRW